MKLTTFTSALRNNTVKLLAGAALAGGILTAAPAAQAQRFFIGFAQVWCQNQRDETARQRALVDPHSPGNWRVNGSVQNFDEFGKAFGCTKGQPMYPVNSCRVW